MSLKLYLAAPWVRKASARVAKGYCTRRGIKVVSTWTEQPDEDQNRSDVKDPADFQRFALSDWRELCMADAVVLLFPQLSSQGKSTELGGALMAGKQVVIVGDDGTRSRNIFYHMPQIRFADTLPEAVDWLLADWELELAAIRNLYSWGAPDDDTRPRRVG